MNARKAEPGEPGSAALWPYFLQQGTFLRQSALWCDVWVWHWCSKLWSKRSKHFLQRECLNKFQQIKGYWRSAEYRVWSNAITLTLLSQVTVNQAVQCQAGTKKREIVRHISERETLGMSGDVRSGCYLVPASQWARSVKMSIRSRNPFNFYSGKDRDGRNILCLVQILPWYQLSSHYRGLLQLIGPEKSFNEVIRAFLCPG